MVRSLFLALTIAVAPSLALGAGNGNGNGNAEAKRIVVLTVTVDVAGEAPSTVSGATVSRGWLMSWNGNRAQRREVTLQPVDAFGRAGDARTYRGCTLLELSGLQDDVATGLKLSCQS